MKMKTLHPIILNKLKYNTRRNIITTEHPHIQSRASYLLLLQELKLSKLLTWLKAREEYISTLPELTCCKCGKTNLKKEIQNNRDKEQLKTLATIDHIKPLSKGGAKYDHNNFQLMCYPCNQLKADSYGG